MTTPTTGRATLTALETFKAWLDFHVHDEGACWNANELHAALKELGL